MSTRERPSSRGPPHRELRLSVPVSFGRLHVAPLLPAFLERHPDLHLDLVMEDRFVDLDDEDYDVVVRVGESPGTAVHARRIAVSRRVICGAPAYFARAGTPETPEDLRDHNCLRYAYLASGHVWRLTGADGPVDVAVGGNLTVNNSEAQVPALLAGIGIALLPMFIAEPYLRRRELRTVLDDFHDTRSDIFALCKSGDEAREEVAAWLEHVASALQQKLRWTTTR